MKKLKNCDKRAAVIFLAPSVSGFLLFFLLPFVIGIYYSLVDSTVSGRFVGLANYMELLKNPVFMKACRNTAIFTAVSVPLNMLLSLILAILLNKRVAARDFLRTCFITPLVIPVSSVVLIWQVIFDISGSLNGFLTGLGVLPVDWMKSDWARLVIIVVYLWKNTGYNMVLFIAGLQNIPNEYYEAADMDGAGRRHKFFRITLIYLTPIAFFIFVMSIINSFKVFRETYLIAGAYPHDSIYMLQHYMNNVFASLDYQKLTSAAFLMAVVIYMLVTVFFRLERKINSSIY
jgi:ABC-type sugar transport systems, permease components